MSTNESSNGKGVVIAIAAVMVAYAVALALGFPQLGTQLVVEHSSHEHHSEQAHHGESEAEVDHHAPHAEEAKPTLTEESPSSTEEPLSKERSAEGSTEENTHTGMVSPPFWTVIPFMLLLGAIAVLPLIPATEHWWESNPNRFKVAASLGVVTLLYYGLIHSTPIDGHWPYHFIAQPNEVGLNWGLMQAVLGGALISEFIPFIVLLFSLYTISGGVRIGGDLRANPMTNATFMAVGGLLASFIGTTGAAMLLIRPLLETNKERKHVVHTVVFFIFIVCNCGGCLLPIGDPPLFLGYLQGVPFTWTLFALWKPWLMVNGLLLLVYLLLDELWYYRKETIADIYRDITHTTKLRCEGLGLNVPLLFGVVFAVALLDPTKTLPGTDIHPWMFSREIAQLALVGLSLYLGCSEIRRKNSFNYHAIVEVAALFCGIFVCMQPALQILGEYGSKLGGYMGAEGGVLSTAHYFWITGGLSSVLDNAPTYLVFFKTAEASPAAGLGPLVSGTTVEEPILIAISLGAVFMGAMTYIGNGPNFMVRAIAEKSGVKMPSFFGYVAYSVIFLLPVLVFVAWQTL